MKRAGDVWEKVTGFGALREAALRAAQGKGPSEEAARFLIRLESESLKLGRELREGRYKPGRYRTFWLYEKKPRKISAAPFRDRVVHHALCAAMEARLEAFAIFDSYACRKGKGTGAAIKRAQEFSGKSEYALQMDIAKFFGSVDVGIMKRLLERKFKEKPLLEVMGRILDHGEEGGGKGLPIGNLTSQHLANFYLGHLDHFIKRELGVKRYLRYMDDFIVFGDDKESLWRQRDRIEAWLQENLGLRLKEPRGIVIPIHEGIGFLGMRIWPKLIRFAPDTLRRFRTAFVRLAKLEDPTEKEIRQMQGLLGQAKYAKTLHLRQSLMRSRNG